MTINEAWLEIQNMDPYGEARCRHCGGLVPEEGSPCWDTPLAAYGGDCPGHSREGVCGAFRLDRYPLASERGLPPLSD